MLYVFCILRWNQYWAWQKEDFQQHPPSPPPAKNTPPNNTATCLCCHGTFLFLASPQNGAQIGMGWWWDSLACKGKCNTPEKLSSKRSGLHCYSALTLSLPLGHQMLEKGFPPACRMLQNFLHDFQLLSHFYVQQTSPSKCAGSDSHLVQIGWEAEARSGPDDSCTLACFQTGSVWPKPDTISQN